LRRWTGAGALLLAAFLSYAPALRSGFVWDDDDHVTGNPTLVDLDGLRRIWLDAGATPQYYPLVHTTFWVEHHLWGNRPAGYHTVNVLLHGLSAIVLWRILLLLDVPGAWLAACVFALHPVHVESVAWISERKNVLSGFLYLTSALVYLGRAFSPSRESEKAPPDRPPGTLPLGALLAYVGALLSKTVTATLPVALALVLWWKRGRVAKRELASLGLMLAAGAILGFLTVSLETHQIGTTGPEFDQTPLQRIGVAGRAFWFYLGKLAWPTRLTFIYPRFPLDALAVPSLLAAAAVLTLVALFVARRAVGAGPFVALAFYTVTLFPALGFFDVYPMRYAFVADHFQYLASIGPIAILCAAGRRAGDRFPRAPSWTFPAAAFGVLLVLSVLTFRQSLAYEDAESLWRDTLHKNPGAWMAHNNLGILLAERGDARAAIESFERAIRIKPDHAGAHANLGYLLAREGRIGPAIDHLSRAVALSPDDFRARVHLGDALRESNRAKEAEEEYRHALRLRPGDPEAELRLGSLLLSSGRIDDAIEPLRTATLAGPEQDRVPAWRGLGIALARRGKVKEAIDALRAAVRIAPGDADLRYNLGTLLARDGAIAEATSELEEALRLRPDFAEARRNLQLAREDAVRKGAPPDR
jgi:Flp pilus assembly protein TadD